MGGICEKSPRTIWDCVFCLILGIDRTIDRGGLYKAGHFMQALRQCLHAILKTETERLEAENKRLAAKITVLENEKLARQGLNIHD